jgi:hypothetical protein
LDAGLNNDQKNVSHAMISMIENHLVWWVFASSEWNMANISDCAPKDKSSYWIFPSSLVGPLHAFVLSLFKNRLSSIITLFVSLFIIVICMFQVWLITAHVLVKAVSKSIVNLSCRYSLRLTGSRTEGSEFESW